MHEILNEDGLVVNSSRNMRGVREYAGKYKARCVLINDRSDDSAVFSILFENGCTFVIWFASGQMLRWCLCRWRNLHGAALYVNENECGVLAFDSPVLQTKCVRSRQLNQACAAAWKRERACTMRVVKKRLFQLLNLRA